MTTDDIKREIERRLKSLAKQHDNHESHTYRIAAINEQAVALRRLLVWIVKQERKESK